MVTIEQLLILARDYHWATRISLSDLSTQSCGNEKTLFRLKAGAGANFRSIERAARWFAENWPAGVPWPEGIPRLTS